MYEPKGYFQEASELNSYEAVKKTNYLMKNRKIWKLTGFKGSAEFN